MRVIRNALRINPWAACLSLSVVLLFLARSRARHQVPFRVPPDVPRGNTSFSPTADVQIPRYLHYVFGFSHNPADRAFVFMQYLCINSALELVKPERIYLHHLHPPQGFYWDQLVQRVNETRGQTTLHLVQRDDLSNVFGREIDHFAHKADIVRLEAVYEYGGIYMDTDVLVIRDFGPALYAQQVVMGMESQPDLKPESPPSGLCNAVILARPYAPFIKRWIETYKTFNKSHWAEHSVTKPWELAQAYPTEITVLNKFAFFWPLWHDDHLRLVHRGTAYDFHAADSLAPTYDTQFTYHMWHSVAWERYLRYYDPDRIHNRGQKRGKEREEDGRSDESSFSREARKHVSPAFRKAWREARAKGQLPDEY